MSENDIMILRTSIPRQLSEEEAETIIETTEVLMDMSTSVLGSTFILNLILATSLS